MKHLSDLPYLHIKKNNSLEKSRFGIVNYITCVISVILIRTSSIHSFITILRAIPTSDIKTINQFRSFGSQQRHFWLLEKHKNTNYGPSLIVVRTLSRTYQQIKLAQP